MENKSLNSKGFQTAATYVKAFILLLAICSFSFLKLSAQQLPTDIELLKMMYGSCDPDGKSYTRPHAPGEPTHELYPTVTYTIAFKQICKIDGQNVLFVITQAPITYQSYHTFRLTDYFYFVNYSNTWIFYNIIKGDFSKALVDATKFQFVEIGKDKYALLTTYEIADIANDARSIGLDMVHLTKMNTIGVIDLDYACKADRAAKSQEDPCPVSDYTSTYLITKSDKNYYDIKVHKTKYDYPKDGKPAKVISQEDLIYTYNGKEYILQTK